MNNGKNSLKFAAGDEPSQHDVASEMEMLATYKGLVGFNVDQIKHTCYCGKDAENAPSLVEFSEKEELTFYDQGLLWVLDATDNAFDTVIDFGGDAVDTVVDMGSDVVDAVADAGNEVIDFVAPVVAPVVDVVVAPVVNVVDTVADAVQEALCFWC